MIQENRGSGSELKRKWELAAGLIGVGGEGEGRLAVNRCDVKWPLIYPWNARGAIAGSATLGNYFTARYGGGCCGSRTFRGRILETSPPRI